MIGAYVDAEGHIVALDNDPGFSLTSISGAVDFVLVDAAAFEGKTKEDFLVVDGEIVEVTP